MRRAAKVFFLRGDMLEAVSCCQNVALVDNRASAEMLELECVLSFENIFLKNRKRKVIRLDYGSILPQTILKKYIWFE